MLTLRPREVVIVVDCRRRGRRWGHAGEAAAADRQEPYVRPESLGRLLGTHRVHGADLTLATIFFQDPTGYGRILRDSEGQVIGIVEERDASDAERAIREINP